MLISYLVIYDLRILYSDDCTPVIFNLLLKTFFYSFVLELFIFILYMIVRSFKRVKQIKKKDLLNK